MTFHRKESVRQDDFYPTPPWATRALMNQIALITGTPIAGKRVWEPACGQGDIVRPLRDRGCSVYASDLNDYDWDGQTESRVDFLLTTRSERFDWIITNPPYKLATEFCLTAIQHQPLYGVAMFCRLTFVEGMARHDRLYSDFPPSHVLIFTERVNLNKGSLRRNISTPVGSAWYVWLTGYTGPTNLLWIPPCRSRLERDDDYQDTQP